MIDCVIISIPFFSTKSMWIGVKHKSFRNNFIYECICFEWSLTVNFFTFNMNHEYMNSIQFLYWWCQGWSTSNEWTEFKSQSSSFLSISPERDSSFQSKFQLPKWFSLPSSPLKSNITDASPLFDSSGKVQFIAFLVRWKKIESKFFNCGIFKLLF